VRATSSGGRCASGSAEAAGRDGDGCSLPTPALHLRRQAHLERNGDGCSLPTPALHLPLCRPPLSCSLPCGSRQVASRSGPTQLSTATSRGGTRAGRRPPRLAVLERGGAVQLEVITAEPKVVATELLVQLAGDGEFHCSASHPGDASTSPSPLPPPHRPPPERRGCQLLRWMRIHRWKQLCFAVDVFLSAVRKQLLLQMGMQSVARVGLRSSLFTKHQHGFKE
jgi:hypothetical protein